jgi:hypothetical protein
MINALLLPLLLNGAPGQPVLARQDDPPIQIWISNDRRFLPGDRAKVQVRTEQDGYLIVLHADPEGHLRVLFPLDPDKDNFVRGGKKYEVRGRGGREAFDVDDASGRGTVYAAVSRDPFHFENFVLGDHWDYKAMASSRLANDPEPELNDLVRRMAQGSFDYDILNYDVTTRVVYASDYSSTYYASGYDDPWCYSFSCSRPYYRSPYGVSIGLFFGRPYRRYYYDPYFYAYDPFYNPFFYDPYYYAPGYRAGYGYGYPGRYYGYNDPYYYGRGRALARPYTPYRFRGADGFTAGYRDRRFDSRGFVNTVYTPPISRLRQPSTTTPMRRVGETSGADLPNGLAPRRVIGSTQQLPDQLIEARRARERDQAPRTSMNPQGDQTSEVRRVQRILDEPPQIERARVEGRRAEPSRQESPQVERARSDPRQVDRAPAPQPERRVIERNSSPPPQERSSGRAEGGSRNGGSRSGGGARESDGGGRRRR